MKSAWADRPRVQHPEKDSMSEQTLQDLVIELAEVSGYLVYHTHDSRRSPAGFPDLVMVKGKRVLFVELKSKKGKPSPEQILWGEALASSGCAEYYLWRPEHWDDGTIDKVLFGLAGSKKC